MEEVTTADRFMNGSTNITVSFGATTEKDIRDMATSYLMYKIGWLFVQLIFCYNLFCFHESFQTSIQNEKYKGSE